MKNFIQKGDSLSVTAPYDLVSGAGCQVGTALFGIAGYAAASGASVDLDTEGVFDIAKATGAWTAGDRVYWDNTAKLATTVATSNLRIGLATQNALSADATGRVTLLAGQ